MSFQQQLNLRVLHQIFFAVLLKETCAQLTAPNATCPGQEAVFTCLGDDASGFGATVFRVNDNTTGQCQLDHDMMAPSTLTCGPGGVFTAALEPRVGITYTSILTVTATEKLNGVTIRCLSGSVNKSESLQVISLPSFPVSGSIIQDPDSNTASEVAGSTVISWSPASVSGGGVSYTVSLDGVVVASTTNTTATLTRLDFNQLYSVSVEAMNDCGQSSGSPLQGTVDVTATVVDISFGDFNLTCSQQLSVDLTWIVDSAQLGSVVRPPVTMLRLFCNGVEVLGLTPSDRQTTLDSEAHPGCLHSLIATIEIIATNTVGTASQQASYHVYRIQLPDGPFLVNETKVFFSLNPHCSELDPALFGLTLHYRTEPSDLRTGHISTAEGELVRRSGLSGFQVSFPASTTVVLEYEAVLHYNGLDIERMSTLTDVTGDSSGVAVPVLAVVAALLLVVVVASNLAWCFYLRKASESMTTDIAGRYEMRTEVPLYEDMSEVTTPTEIKTAHNEAYGPVK